MKRTTISKAVDRLALQATKYTQALGTESCARELDKLKRAARDYANSLRHVSASRPRAEAQAWPWPE